MLEKIGNVYFEREPYHDLEVMVIEELADIEGYLQRRYTARGRIPLNVWGFWMIIRDLLDELIKEDEDKYKPLKPILDALNKAIPEGVK